MCDLKSCGAINCDLKPSGQGIIFRKTQGTGERRAIIMSRVYKKTNIYGAGEKAWLVKFLICNPSTGEAETGGSLLAGQLT